jgi:protein translocase SecG subunit
VPPSRLGTRHRRGGVWLLPASSALEAEMLIVAQVLACVSGIGLILAVLFQTTTAEGFSASMGGQETARFQKGSRDETLEKVAKIGAIVWIVTCFITAILWYHQAR